MKHTYESWYNQIMGYERTYKKWENRTDRIIRRYKDDSRFQNNPNARFNILWSNVQTIFFVRFFSKAIFSRVSFPIIDNFRLALLTV